MNLTLEFSVYEFPRNCDIDLLERWAEDPKSLSKPEIVKAKREFYDLLNVYYEEGAEITIARINGNIIPLTVHRGM